MGKLLFVVHLVHTRHGWCLFDAHWEPVVTMTLFLYSYLMHTGHIWCARGMLLFDAHWSLVSNMALLDAHGAYLLEIELHPTAYHPQSNGLVEKFHKHLNSLNTRCVYACDAHTTITPFMHDLDIACKNVLISHNFMMHANACGTCNLINTCTK